MRSFFQLKYVILLTPDKSLALDRVIRTCAVNDMLEKRCGLFDPNKIDLCIELLTLRSGNHETS